MRVRVAFQRRKVQPLHRFLVVFDDAQTVAVKPPWMPLRDAAAPFRRAVKPLRRLVVFDFAEVAFQ